MKPETQEELANMIFEVQNWSDATLVAVQLWPHLIPAPAQPVAWQWFWKSRNKWVMLKLEGDPTEKELEEFRADGLEVRPLYASQPSPAATVETASNLATGKRDHRRVLPGDCRPNSSAATGDDLLPCPFCGGEADFYENWVDHERKWSVSCGDCNANLDVCEDTKTEAAAHWNVRLRAVPQAASMREALKEISAIGGKITDPRNLYGIQMTNIAFAALALTRPHQP
jgi:Lar family restriction alleviation protein